MEPKKNPDRKPSTELIRSVRHAIGMLVEEANADAVVICVTRHKKNQTESFAYPWGNLHACRGLVEYAFSELCSDPEDEEEEEEETEEAADDDDE